MHKPMQVSQAVGQRASDQGQARNLPKMACDFCKQDVSADYYDGKTIFGPWATMCGEDFARNGVGLGTGRGQHFVNGRKVEG